MSNQPINDGGPAFPVDKVVPDVILSHDLFNMRYLRLHQARKPVALRRSLSIWTDEGEGENLRKNCPNKDGFGRNGGKVKNGLQGVQPKDELAVKRRKIDGRIIAAQSRRINGAALQSLQHKARNVHRRLVLLPQQTVSCMSRLQSNFKAEGVL